MLAARKKNLSTARARKNKHTARMLANARKDHSIPLKLWNKSSWESQNGFPFTFNSFPCREKYRYLSPLTAEEEKEIVSAMNLSQGRWYKCPQGHVYSIGGCGEAMQRATCPECKLVIGVTRHQLFEGNMRAPEMMESARTRLGRLMQNYTDEKKNLRSKET